MFNVTSAASGSGTTLSPWTGWEAAVNALPANIAIYFPAGEYTQSTRIEMKNGWVISGDGEGNSRITSSMSGTAFRSNFVPPAATYTALRDLQIRNTNPCNKGSGYLDFAGKCLEVVNVKIEGFRFGISLLYSEIVTIDGCFLDQQTRGGVWIVNNGDYNLINADFDYSSLVAGVTNVIQITRCQFNHNHTCPVPTPPEQRCEDDPEIPYPIVQIIDDGGYTHEFTHNNFNGGNMAIRMCNVLNNRIAASHFEIQQTDVTQLTTIPYHQSRSQSPTPIGPVGTVNFDTNFISTIVASPCAGAPAPRCFDIQNVETLLLIGNNISSNVPATRNASSANTIVNVRSKVSGAPLLDGSPAHLIDLGSNTTTAEVVMDALRMRNNKALRMENTAAVPLEMLKMDASNQMYVGHPDPAGVNNLHVQAGQNIIFQRGVSPTTVVGGFSSDNAFFVPDGIPAPGTATGRAFIYVDIADGDLKVRFGDGTTKTIATD